LPHDAMHSADYAIVCCLSVRPSVIFVYCIETIKCLLKLFYGLVDPAF